MMVVEQVSGTQTALLGEKSGLPTRFFPFEANNTLRSDSLMECQGGKFQGKKVDFMPKKRPNLRLYG